MDDKYEVGGGRLVHFVGIFYLYDHILLEVAECFILLEYFVNGPRLVSEIALSLASLYRAVALWF